MASPVENFLRIFNPDFLQNRAQELIGQREQQLMQTLGNQQVTQPMMGPLQPRQERPDVTAIQQGTGIVPQPVAEVLSRLMANPMTQQVGQGLLQQQFAGPGELRTEAGKTIADRQQLVNQYGRNSPQLKAFDEMINAEDVDLSDVSGMRKEFTAQSQDFIKVRDAFGKVKNSANKPSAAGDLALIFNYMKMLDPGSVVREGEFATAQNATNVPGMVRNMYNRLIETGQRLAPEQRADFLATARGVMDSQLKFQNQLENEFSRIAQAQGMDPENVIVDYVGDFRSAAAPEAPKDPQQRTKNTIYQTPKGPLKWTGTGWVKP